MHSIIANVATSIMLIGYCPLKRRFLGAESRFQCKFSKQKGNFLKLKNK